MAEVATPVDIRAGSEEPYTKQDIAKRVHPTCLIPSLPVADLETWLVHHRMIAEMNERPFHIQAIKTKFLDATLKDSTVGTSGGMTDATNPIKVQWEVNAQKVRFASSRHRCLEYI